MTDWRNHALSIHPDMEVAFMVVSKAGEIIRAGYGKRHSIEEKGIGDLVSEVDRKCDQAIMECMRKMRPEDAILSEELQPQIDINLSRFWIVDPLDGTAAFLFEAGESYPAVLIALRENGRTVLGVCYFPLTEEWFYAVYGQGAFKNGKRLCCSSFERDLAQVWVEMNHYGDKRFETDQFCLLRDRLRLPGGCALVTITLPYSGMAMRFLEGDNRPAVVIHDNNPHKVKQGAWDTAAPQLIVEEAGGVFWNLRGQRYDPFKPEPILIARTRSLGEQVCGILK